VTFVTSVPPQARAFGAAHQLLCLLRNAADLAFARAALREGVEQLPVAELAGVELDIRLLVDHRERLVVDL
jgi:hypothetical protein